MQTQLLRVKLLVTQGTGNFCLCCRFAVLGLKIVVESRMVGNTTDKFGESYLYDCIRGENNVCVSQLFDARGTMWAVLNDNFQRIFTSEAEDFTLPLQ